MKKMIAFAMSAVMALSLTTTAFAAGPASPASAIPVVVSPGPEKETQPGYTLRIDGEDTEVRACVMVPLRAVAEKLGFTVTWNGDGSILLNNGVMHSTVIVGQDRYQVSTSNPDLVGMSAPFSLGVPPCLVNGTTYVSLGLFDALLGSQQGAVTMENGVISLNTDPLNKGDNSAQMPNPFTEYTSMDEAAAAAGFHLTLPKSAEEYADRAIQVLSAGSNPMLEVICRTGDGKNELRIRKAAGSEDISGDYTQYAESNTVSVGKLQVTMKGENGQVRLAVWTNNGYTYSVGIYAESGISRKDMTNLVTAVQ